MYLFLAALGIYSNVAQSMCALFAFSESPFIVLLFCAAFLLPMYWRNNANIAEIQNEFDEAAELDRVCRGILEFEHELSDNVAPVVFVLSPIIELSTCILSVYIYMGAQDAENRMLIAPYDSNLAASTHGATEGPRRGEDPGFRLVEQSLASWCR